MYLFILSVKVSYGVKIMPISLKWLSNMSCLLNYYTVLRCQILHHPLNGFLVGDCDNSYGSTCRMSCNAGYNLLGSENLTCLNKPGHITGYWDKPVPVCKSNYFLNCVPKITYLCSKLCNDETHKQIDNK